MTVEEWKNKNKFQSFSSTCSKCTHCHYDLEKNILFCSKMYKETDSYDVTGCEVNGDKSFCEGVIEE